MKLPERIQEKLEENQELYGQVLQTITAFGPWLASNRLTFFDEYTDHGISHLESVLLTADALIRDEAWPTLTAADVAVLSIATFLHDCAMHLTEEGFVALVDSKNDEYYIQGFGDKKWSHLWSDFIQEARRFDGRKLTALFGDNKPIRVPSMDSEEMTARDRKLIGEFLRRHHHRLAHEIARFGVPSLQSSKLRLPQTLDYVADLAGLVARSHGMPIRSCLNYLKNSYKVREFRGIRSPFLMAVIRIADYLQVQSQRAPSQVLQVRTLRSPVSKGEWDAHQCIADITNTHDDPEAIYIHAQPKHVGQFLKVKQWLGGIQDELDKSWAVLGEVYGRVDGLKQLGLVLRRVRSNLDDEVEFAKTVDFIPQKASFEAADADLLKLLIEPLYGNNPSIGIRELLQNSLDAVREREEYERQTGSSSRPQSREWDVLVSLDKRSDGQWDFSIVDRGIGMRPETIMDYFLKAGASFRRSQNWRDQFETKEGHSKVLRAGRFGVGALAAFLLGSELRVTTRYIDDSNGLGTQFSATVDSDYIELKRTEAEIGTSITIKVNDLVGEALANSKEWLRTDWNWFLLRSPKVLRRLNGNIIKDGKYIPSQNQNLPLGWHRIKSNGYDDIQWSFDHFSYVNLACNGIKVVPNEFANSGYYYSNYQNSIYRESDFIPIKYPFVSVFDPDGKLPLNLQRSELTDRRYPFQDELIDSMISDLIAYLLVYTPANDALGSSKIFSGKWPGFFTHYGNYFCSIFYTAQGVSPVGQSMIESAISDSFNIVSGWGETFPSIAFHEGSCVFPWNVSKKGSLKELIRFILADYDAPLIPLNFSREVIGSRILMPKIESDRLLLPGQLSIHIRESVHIEREANGWVLWNSGISCEPKSDFDELLKIPLRSSYQNVPLYVEIYLSNRSVEVTSKIREVWNKHYGKPYVPFDMDERHSLILSKDEVEEKVKMWSKIRENEKKKK